MTSSRSAGLELAVHHGDARVAERPGLQALGLGDGGGREIDSDSSIAGQTTYTWRPLAICLRTNS